MTERARWVYAVPPEGEPAIPPILEAGGFSVVQTDPETAVVRYENAAHDASFVTFANAELEVLFVEAAGDEAAATLGQLLDKTGFYAQSDLLGTALDVRDPEAAKALRTLAHMVVAWDADWTDLFLLHLACPDPILRHDAVAALSVAVLVTRDLGPAAELLEEAMQREKFPKLKETMAEALRMLRVALGGPVEVPSDVPSDG